MFDALTSMFEGNNINRRMTLRNQLKGMKVQNSEMIILLKSISYRRIVRIHWWDGGRIRSGDEHLEWSYEIMAFLH